MRGIFTTYLNDKVLDLVFGSAAFSVPPTLYVGLSRDTANRDGWYQEPSGGGYARAALINDLISFKGAAGGVKANAMEISFPSPVSDWGVIRSVFVADAAAGGNVFAMSDLKDPRRVLVGDQSMWISESMLHFVMS